MRHPIPQANLTNAPQRTPMRPPYSAPTGDDTMTLNEDGSVSLFDSRGNHRGTLQRDGSFMYDAEDGYSGSDDFTYPTPAKDAEKKKP